MRFFAILAAFVVMAGACGDSGAGSSPSASPSRLTEDEVSPAAIQTPKPSPQPTPNPLLAIGAWASLVKVDDCLPVLDMDLHEDCFYKSVVTDSPWIARVSAGPESLDNALRWYLDGVGWVLQDNLQFHAGPGPIAVEFVDPDHGWVVMQGINEHEDTDTLWRTDDGGATWTQQFATATGIEAVDFYDELHGWMLSGGLVYTTDDRGRSWMWVSQPQNVRSVNAVGASAALVVDDSDIWVTLDAGASFDLVTNPCVEGPKWNRPAISFVSSQSGYVQCYGQGGGLMTPSGTVYRTVDGGTSWIEVARYTGRSTGSTRAKFAQGQDAVFISESMGWTVTGCEPAPCKILRTTDAGASWEERTPEGRHAFMGAPVFTDENHGWVLAFDQGFSNPGVILATEDGGLTWQEAPGPLVE